MTKQFREAQIEFYTYMFFRKTLKFVEEKKLTILEVWMTEGATMKFEFPTKSKLLLRMKRELTRPINEGEK